MFILCKLVLSDLWVFSEEQKEPEKAEQSDSAVEAENPVTEGDSDAKPPNDEVPVTEGDSDAKPPNDEVPEVAQQEKVSKKKPSEIIVEQLTFWFDNYKKVPEPVAETPEEAETPQEVEAVKGSGGDDA